MALLIFRYSRDKKKHREHTKVAEGGSGERLYSASQWRRRGSPSAFFHSEKHLEYDRGNIKIINQQRKLK